MGYVITALVSIVLTLVLVSWGDIRSSLRRRKNKKRLNRLASGVPSHVVTLYEFDDIFENRYHPFYIDGKSYLMSPEWVHCNDESYSLYDIHGALAGHIATQIILSRKVDGKWRHYRGIKFWPENGEPRFVIPCSIKAIY